MAVTRDWIPKQIHTFKIFADNLCKRVRDNAEAWHLDADEVNNLLSLRLKFNKYFRRFLSKKCYCIKIGHIKSDHINFFTVGKVTVKNMTIETYHKNSVIPYKK